MRAERGPGFLKFMSNFGGHCFLVLKTRLFLAKSDILIPKCTEGGGGGLGNIPKKYQYCLCLPSPVLLDSLKIWKTSLTDSVNDRLKSRDASASKKIVSWKFANGAYCHHTWGSQYAFNPSYGQQWQLVMSLSLIRGWVEKEWDKQKYLCLY